MTIPSYQQQSDLAERVRKVIGGAIEIDGRRFTVSRHGNEIRFHGASKFSGEIAPDAYVQILRGDLAKLSTRPSGYRDRKIEDRAVAVVCSVLGGLR